MKKILLSLIILGSLLAFDSMAQQWAPAGERIKTVWADEVDPNNPLPEYPRPQMKRNEWVNLNGLWNYSIIAKSSAEPTSFDGKILVPYAIESSLSGVQKRITSEQEIWYDRSFEVPSSWKGCDVILNFGAVDWKADVYINDILIGSHTGGYTPFSFNITPYLTKGSQKLNVRVWDSTDSGMQPRGKQVNDPEGIYYTPVSGIWQTVWIEPVASSHITAIKTTPNLDAKAWQIKVDAENLSAGDLVVVDLYDGASKVAQAKGVAGTEFLLHITDPKLWSPDTPFLYDMDVKLLRGGKVVDQVGSYTAMRKISMQGHKGYYRMFLNNEPLFQYGPLDQGWWPDGLYTQPSDKALVHDIQVTKDLGYNMIRKHVKVESARWYYYCDKMGILVWQDMPSGDYAEGQLWQKNTMNGGHDAMRSTQSKDNYKKEWKEIMDYCMSFPSIVVWVPFNEAWGQFNTLEIAEWTKNYDPSRLVNPASGGNHTSGGDILDTHEYPWPRMMLLNAKKINVLGEYGGIGLPLEGHIWDTDMKNWGYGGVRKDKNDVTELYIKYAKMLIPFIQNGYAAAVYTQISDVEGEVNGIMTYDRKEIKMDVERIREVNLEIIDSMK